MASKTPTIINVYQRRGSSSARHDLLARSVLLVHALNHIFNFCDRQEQEILNPLPHATSKTSKCSTANYFIMRSSSLLALALVSVNKNSLRFMSSPDTVVQTVVSECMGNYQVHEVGDAHAVPVVQM